MNRPARAIVVVVVILVLGACGTDGSAGTSGTEADEPALEGTITVSAATSLTAAFTDLREAFVAAHPDVEVELNFDASSALAAQVLEGAPVDVFASADEANMTKLTDEALVAGKPVTFARNELVIVTKPGNPAGIGGLADLAEAGVIALCGEEVPCGRYAQEALTNAGVTIAESSVTRGQNVGATLTAVTEGDAVAGIVYLTDAAGAGDAVEAVTIPADLNVIATYPIGALTSAGAADVAQAFIDFVLSAEGQAILVEYGFVPVE